MAREREKFQFNPIDSEKDTAVGIGLPFAGNRGLFHLNYTTEEQALDNLKNLILTRKGERYMQPQFGWSGWDLLFEANTDDLVDKLKLSFSTDVAFWLPYIIIDKVNVNQMDNTDGHGISITVDIRIEPSLANKTITINLSSTGGVEIVEG